MIGKTLNIKLNITQQNQTNGHILSGINNLLLWSYTYVLQAHVIKPTELPSTSLGGGYECPVDEVVSL